MYVKHLFEFLTHNFMQRSMFFFSLYFLGLVVCVVSAQEQNEQCKLNVVFEKRVCDNCTLLFVAFKTLTVTRRSYKSEQC